MRLIKGVFLPFQSLRPMLDLSLLQSPTFLVLALNGFLTLFCFFVPFAFIGALADERIISSSLIGTNHSIEERDEDFPSGEEEGGEGSSQLLLVLLGETKSNYFSRRLIIFIRSFQCVWTSAVWVYLRSSKGEEREGRVIRWMAEREGGWGAILAISGP